MYVDYVRRYVISGISIVGCTRISDLGKRDSSLTSNTNDAQTPDAYDGIAHVRVPPGYADRPEDERILPSLTLTNDSSFGDFIYYEGTKVFIYSMIFNMISSLF